MLEMAYFSTLLLLLVLCIYFLESDGAWSTWGAWSSCTATCGFGLKSRVRTCDGVPCPGPGEIHIACQEAECPNEDVTWSTWGEWSSCSRTCGGGNKTRERTCSSGHVTDCCDHSDMESCTLEYTQSRECVNEDCYGTWTDWRQWSLCSVKCGEGVQSRHRECEPQGDVCPGGGEQSRVCYVQCASSDNLLDSTDVSCYPDNPCQHGGVCESMGDHVQCRCQGDWRGPGCSSMCLNPSDTGSCSNKEGLFHDCTDCSKFVICSRGNVISMSCVSGRIWTGNGCKPPEDTTTVCVE